MILIRSNTPAKGMKENFSKQSLHHHIFQTFWTVRCLPVHKMQNRATTEILNRWYTSNILGPYTIEETKPQCKLNIQQHDISSRTKLICLWNYLRLKTMTIAVQLSLQCLSRTASLTRRRLTAVTGKPSCFKY